jgi:superfamily II DNA or RNA helicase
MVCSGRKDMGKKFAVILQQHRKFGFIAACYLLYEKPGYLYLTVLEKVTHKNGNLQSLSESEKELVDQCESIADDNLFNHFGKKYKSYTDFFQRVKPELTEKQIIPFIERKLALILKKLVAVNTLFYQVERRPKNLYPEDRLNYSLNPAKAVFNFSLTKEDFRYFLSIESDGKDLSLTDKAATIIMNDPCFLILENQLLHFDDIDGKKLLPFFTKEYVSIPKSAERKYLETFVKNSIASYKVRSNGFSIVEQYAIPRTELLLEENLSQQNVFALHFHYDEEFSLNYHSKQRIGVILDKVDGIYIFRKVLRNSDHEASVIEGLADKGLYASQGDYFVLNEGSGGVEELIDWCNAKSKWLSDSKINFRQNLNGKKYLFEKPALKFEVDSKIDWFDIYGTVTVGNFEFSFFKLKNFILSGTREFPLPDGTTAILPDEWFVRYEGIFQMGKEKNGRISLKNQHFNLLRKASPEKKAEYIQQLAELSTMLDNPSLDLPSGLNAKLRPYQKEGYSWMSYLKLNNFGGCLADDMGLGKTLQTLTLILSNIGESPSAQKRVEKSGDMGVQLDLFGKPDSEDSGKPNTTSVPATLIVMPTSLIHNWKNEIDKFTPSLRVYKHHGSNRYKSKSPERVFDHYHVILTSYGTLRLDVEYLKNYQFQYIILDESQYIKNPGSKIYKSLLQLNARYRLALTGTPIENSLRDLWTQMNFLNPGLLGGLDFFTRKFTVPIEKGNNEEQRELLRTIIQPFILRRTKKEVARDLPDLFIQTIYCNLEEQQQEEYQLEKNMVRTQVLNTIEKNGIQNSAMYILQGLQRLRQLAIHPAMLDEDYKGTSGKFEEVLRMLESLRSEGHKVLLFSSFVKHLNLFKKQFDKKKWKYSMLTGSTTKREAVINEFQNSSENQIFLISIKAGGVGLNLTSADYVFILDPWWNPAVEMQAINRVHRIGQDKHVFVYRFISEGSIEEKIDKLQQSKSAMADQFVNSNNPFAAMDVESIKSFLS